MMNSKIDILYVFNFSNIDINNAILRLRCSLKSIVMQNVQICISNNSETCILDAISDIDPNIKYIHTFCNKPFSRALGINYGVKKLVTTEYFIISDIDLVYSKDHIQRLFIKFEFLKRPNELIRFVTYNYNLQPIIQTSFIGKLLNKIPIINKYASIFTKESPHLYSHEYEVLDQIPKSNGGYAHGNGLIHKDSFYKIKGYDEEMIGYGPEDDLFNTRISKINRIIYDNLNDTSTFHLWHPRFQMIQFEKNMEIWKQKKSYINSLLNPTIEDIIANKNKKDWGSI